MSVLSILPVLTVTILILQPLFSGPPSQKLNQHTEPSGCPTSPVVIAHTIPHSLRSRPAYSSCDTKPGCRVRHHQKQRKLHESQSVSDAFTQLTAGICTTSKALLDTAEAPADAPELPGATAAYPSCCPSDDGLPLTGCQNVCSDAPTTATPVPDPAVLCLDCPYIQLSCYPPTCSWYRRPFVDDCRVAWVPCAAPQ